MVRFEVRVVGLHSCMHACLCMYLIDQQSPFRLQIVVKCIKNRHFWSLPRIEQESIKILISTVASNIIGLLSHDRFQSKCIACRS